MKSIFKPTVVAKSQTRIKSPSSVPHWLLSLSFHITVISVLVLLTPHSKNQKIPPRIVEVAYVFTEQESQKKNPSATATHEREDQEKNETGNQIVSTNQTKVGDESNQSKLMKTGESDPPNAQSQELTPQESKEFTELSAKEQNLSRLGLDPLRTAKKNVEPHAERSPINDDYTEFLTRIEGRKPEDDSKPVAVKSGFSSMPREFLKGKSRKNNSIPNTKGSATSCSVKASDRQALLSDKNSPLQYNESGSNEAIRISDLLGHGRYVQPSTSVRVSDLLSVRSQFKQIRSPNASVTVNDLLRQHGSGFHSFCR